MRPIPTVPTLLFFVVAGCAGGVSPTGGGALMNNMCDCPAGPPGAPGASVFLRGAVNTPNDCDGAGGYWLSYNEIGGQAEERFPICHGKQGLRGEIGTQGDRGPEGPPGALVAIQMDPTIFGTDKLQVGTPFAFRDDPDMRLLFGSYFIQVHQGPNAPPNFPENGYVIPWGYTRIHWNGPNCDSVTEKAYIELGIGAVASGWDLTGPSFLYRKNISGTLYRVKQPATQVQTTVTTYSTSAFCNPPQPRSGIFYELEPSGFTFPIGVTRTPIYTSVR